MGQTLRYPGDSQVAGGGSYIPVLPAMVAAHGNMVAPGTGPGQTHGACRSIRAVLGKAYRFCAGHQLDHGFRHLGFQPVGQGEADTVLHLFLHGGINVGVAIAQGDRQQRIDEIYIFITVHIPDAAAPAPFQEIRRNTPGQCHAGFGKGLRTQRNDCFRTRQPFL